MARSAATIAAATAETAAKASIKALLIQLKWPNIFVEAFVAEQDIDELDMLRYLPRTRSLPSFAHSVSLVEVMMESIYVMAEEILKMLLFLIRHRDRVSRQIVLDDVEFAGIRVLTTQRDLEQATKDNKMVEPPSVNLRSMPKTMENVRDWCSKICRVTGAPLAYMMHVKIMPESEEDALPQLFDSVDNEMIESAPIIDLSYDYDTDTNLDEDLEAKGPLHHVFPD